MIMPIDPYAALHALLRAEAARTTHDTPPRDPATPPSGPSPGSGRHRTAGARHHPATPAVRLLTGRSARRRARGRGAPPRRDTGGPVPAATA
ncbi:hypothetical protein ACWCP6_09275 [Streptomyces sp. NPDC002004]